MNKLLTLFTFLFALYSCFSTVYSQSISHSVIGSMGSSNVIEGLTIQQTIGQPALTSCFKNSDGIMLRQGFQQPVLFQQQSLSKIINVAIYPNPNDGTFNLLVDIEKDKKYTIEIYDLNGKLIFKSNYLGGNIEYIKLPMETPRASYTLKLFTQDNFVGNAKIIVN